jgi:hypothetical protein
MVRFTIMDLGSTRGELQYLIKEIRQKGLIAGTEKDVHNETIYHTNSIGGIKKVMEDYEGLILDIIKDK